MCGGEGAEPESALGVLPVWHLEDLYESPDSARIERDVSWLEGECAAFASELEGRLTHLDGNGLLDAVRRFEAIVQRKRRLSLYAGLRFQQDTQDPERGKFLADIHTRLTEVTRSLVFFTLELNRIEDKSLSDCFAACPELGHYRVWLGRVRAMRPHQLAPEIETFAHDFAPVQDAAWGRLFSETVSSLSFELDGESLSLERALHVLQESDRGRRQRAHQAIAGGMENNKRLFARITNTLVQSKEIEDRWRKLPTPQFARHLANDIEPEIVGALRDAVVNAYSRISHRYYALKARWMGLENLESWDRNAPLPGQGDRVYSWKKHAELSRRPSPAFPPE